MSTWNNAPIHCQFLRRLSCSLLTIALAFVFVGCGTETMEWQSGQENTESADNPDPSEEPSSSASGLIKEASPGDTVVLSAGTYNESLTLPAGIHLCGADHETVIIRPPAGSAGIEVTGAGQSRICNLTVQEASGHGIVSMEADLEIEDVTTQNTSAIDKEAPGHGVHIQNASTLKAINLNSIDNAGAGLSAVGVQSVSIIVPDFVPSPDADPETIGIIVPDFIPETPNKESASSSFKGNGQNGIVIIVPDFLEGYGEEAAPESEVMLGGLFLADNEVSAIFLQGAKSILDQCAIYGSVSKSIVNEEKWEWTDNVGGHGVAAFNGGTLALHNNIISDNAGVGVISSNLRNTWIADNTEVPRDPAGPIDQIGIIVPDFKPGNAIMGNAMGGIAIIDPIDPLGGKSDSVTLSHWIAGAQVSENGQFGVSILGATATVSSSVISGTTKEEDEVTTGTGVYIHHSLTDEDRTSSVQMDGTNLITSNEGFGIRIGGTANVQVQGEISKNGGGGVRIRGNGTDVHIGENTVIAENKVVGVTTLANTTLTIKKTSILSSRKEQNDEDLSSQTAFGDGIWAIEATHLTIEDTLIESNHRAGLILLDMMPENLSLKNVTFSNNMYGLVCLHGTGDVVAAWNDENCEGCSYHQNTLGDTADNGCLPIFDDSCGELETCEPFYPCGECADLCGDDQACILDHCESLVDPAECDENICSNSASECHIATCENGICVESAKEDGTGCDDNNLCTNEDQCMEGVCMGSPVVCENTDNPCKLSICHEETGSCIAQEEVDGTACDDSDPCTLDNFCQGGQCVGTSLDCDDGKPCTNEYCDSTSGECVYSNVTESSACDDGDLCTENDQCNGEGTCLGSAVECNDNNDCTYDACTPGTGCEYQNKNPGKACDDGDNCTIQDQCDGEGNCISLETLNCEDGNPCTSDSCSDAGNCIFSAIPQCEACPEKGFGACPESDSCPTSGDTLGEINLCDGDFLSNNECVCLGQNSPCTEFDYSPYGNADDPGYSICMAPSAGQPGIVRLHVKESGGYPPQPGAYTVKYLVAEDDPVLCWQNGIVLHECVTDASAGGDCIADGNPTSPGINQAFDIPDITLGHLFNSTADEIHICVGNNSMQMLSGTIRVDIESNSSSCPAGCTDGEPCDVCNDGNPCTKDICDTTTEDNCAHVAIENCTLCPAEGYQSCGASSSCPFGPDTAGGIRLCNEDGTLDPNSPCKCLSLGFSCNDGYVEGSCISNGDGSSIPSTGWCQQAHNSESGTLSFFTNGAPEGDYVLKYVTNPAENCLTDGTPILECTLASDDLSGSPQYACETLDISGGPDAFPVFDPLFSVGIEFTAAGMLTVENPTAYFCLEGTSCNYDDLQLDANEAFGP